MGYKYPKINASEIDNELKAFNAVSNTDNNGKVLFIKDGEIAVDTYSNLFTIISFDED